MGGINVTGTIAGNTGSANSDLVIDGGTNGAGTVTLASTSTYYGPTYIVNGATLYANAANAIPTTNGQATSTSIRIIPEEPTEAVPPPCSLV